MQVTCKALRPTTGSKIDVEIPEDVVKESSTAEDPTIMSEYVGELLDWRFIPMQFIFTTDLPDISVENE